MLQAFALVIYELGQSNWKCYVSVLLY